ncbi:hypothetical protein RND71_032886 [Anisodus tanguticus]|uniref:CASP-like protein n=1 Tax=Anisodus tanguticus TaxID=243964 RepID=A0AAE1RA39_9SOLA|nr:hypothetical protein RND71_032886 [Anisodus tanguticus]
MDALPGTLGTSASLALRLGQAIFSVASLLFMCLDVPFYSYTAFWSWGFLHAVSRTAFVTVVIEFCKQENFLVTVMGLVMAWSLTLVMVDAFSVLIKRPARQPGIISVVVLGDWVLSFLSLAASCSTASVVDYLLCHSSPFCDGTLCTRYQLSATMAFLSWSLILASALFNLWLLAIL